MSLNSTLSPDPSSKRPVSATIVPPLEGINSPSKASSNISGVGAMSSETSVPFEKYFAPKRVAPYIPAPAIAPTPATPAVRAKSRSVLLSIEISSCCIARSSTPA